MNIFGNIVAAWQFIKSCARFLNHNRDLLFFPIISIIAAGSFIALTFFSSILGLPTFLAMGNSTLDLLITCIGLIFIYFLLSFIILYFNASLVACAILRLDGKEGSLGDGLEMAARHWWALVQWSVISATVGLIIRAMENSHNTIEEIIGSILGVAWSIGAFFVVPILIFEDSNIIQAFKRSYAVFGRGWQKAISVHLIFALGFGAIFGLLYLLGHLLPFEMATFFDIGIAVFILMLFFMSTIGNAFNSIITSALYLSIVQGNDPKGFDKNLLDKAFKQKNIS